MDGPPRLYPFTIHRSSAFCVEPHFPPPPPPISLSHTQTTHTRTHTQLYSPGSFLQSLFLYIQYTLAGLGKGLTQLPKSLSYSDFVAPNEIFNYTYTRIHTRDTPPVSLCSRRSH